jgi:hypothetical protein
VIDNVTNGFDLHDLNSGSLVQTFKTSDITRREPKQVVFAEDSRIVVGGSDHGIVYVFDRRTGAILEKLPHANKGLVQTITVS